MRKQRSKGNPDGNAQVRDFCHVQRRARRSLLVEARKVGVEVMRDKREFR